MDDRHFHSSVDDGVMGFRPKVLYDSQVDRINDSLTMSQSRKDPLFDFDALELDDIDAECSVENPDEIVNDLDSPATPQDRGGRVNGELFYYRALGSLRSELVPIKLLDRRHVGLAVSVLASGSMAAILHAAYRPLLLSTMSSERKMDHDPALLYWGEILSAFLGLVSDCVPVCGTRRKAYIVLGWVLSTLSFASVLALHVWELASDRASNATLERLLVIFSILGSISLQLSWVAALAFIVEFGQREVMRERGGLATWILLLWQLGALSAHVGVATFHASVTMLNASAAIATISIVVVPFVLWLVHEDEEQGSTATLVASTKQIGVVPALRTGILQFGEICQEIVTHRVLLFLLLYGMLLHARDPSVDRALASWSGFAYVNDPWVCIVMSGGTIMALLYAKWRLLRTAWRHLALGGTGIIVITATVQATVITTNTLRTQWFYALCTVIRAWPTSWLALFTVLATTEIAHVGCEGVTMGFVLSGQAIGSIAMNAVAEWISPPLTTPGLIHKDSLSTRTRILGAALGSSSFNLIAAAAVLLLPRSKFATQQLRGLGGHDRKGAVLLVVVFVVLLALVIVANVM